MNKRAQVITKGQFLLMVILIVIVSLIFGNGWLSGRFIVFLIGLLLVNPILSFIVGTNIEKFGGEWLKKIFLNYEIEGFEFSVSAFAVLTFILVLIIRNI